MGKLTTHEFADGGPSFDLPKPPARNPWNPEHFTAGSSSGTGAAVASGMILCGIGTDTGGSIRGPAALCGIAGIKPTYGLVSRAGVAPAAFSLDHIGPMAWSAEDCAIMLQVLAGHDPKDPASASRPIPDYTALIGTALKGVKVGVIRHFHETDLPVAPATQQGIDNALMVFRDLGASVSDVMLSPLQDWHACGSLISITERAAAYEEWARTRLGDFSERVQRRLMLGRMVSGVDYVQAVRRRRELRAELQAAMAGLDVVVTAGAPDEASKMDGDPELGSVRQAELHHAVQRLRLSRDLRLFGVRPAGTAGFAADRRQAVPGSQGVPGRRRVREGNRFPRPTAGDGRIGPGRGGDAASLRATVPGRRPPRPAARWICHKGESP